jgi:protein ImuB
MANISRICRAPPDYESRLKRPSPQLPDATRLDVTLARIRAVVGEENVGSPVLNDSHRSDDFKMLPFTVTAERGRQPSFGGVATALRQLRPPEDVTVILQQ